MDAQEPGHHKGKVLRLRDDGTVPPDNPFVGRAGYKPEIYSLGHRNQLGLAIHPETGAVWANEHGPNGGDEINVILPGRNYGWPIVSLGRDYAGPWQGKFAQEGIEPPVVSGCRRSPCRAWRSTPAIGSRRGRATCSSARCAWAKSRHRPPAAHRVQREERRAAAAS